MIRSGPAYAGFVSNAHSHHRKERKGRGMNFFEQLRRVQAERNSLLCVGLDPDIEAICDSSPYRKPEGCILQRCFTTEIIEKTAPFVSAFKPNMAFWSELRDEDGLEWCIEKCHRTGTPVVIDGKRGDIGNTAEKYAQEVFVRFKADAVTVNPYMGCDTIEPFLRHEGKGVIVLCRTSNPGGADFQNLVLENGLRLYEQVAYKMLELDAKYGGGRIGLVVGATFPSELERVRSIVGNRETGLTLLVPGIGAQGGDVEATVKAGQTADGFGMMINSSRGILYSPDPAKAALATRDQINLYRNRSTVTA